MQRPKRPKRAMNDRTACRLLSPVTGRLGVIRAVFAFAGYRLPWRSCAALHAAPPIIWQGV